MSSANYQQYEYEKQRLQRMNLTPEQYQRAIAALAKKLRI